MLLWGILKICNILTISKVLYIEDKILWEVFTMKLTKIISAVIAAAIASSGFMSAYATSIPRESAPTNATEDEIIITENIIGDILDEVASGELGYQMAAGRANTKVRQAVIAGQTNGYGFAALKPIAQNAIRTIRDMYLRPEAYEQAEEKVKELISDLIDEVKDGGDYETALNAAYTRIYQSVDSTYNPEDLIGVDLCYVDIPAVDSIMFNRARALLLEARD